MAVAQIIRRPIMVTCTTGRLPETTALGIARPTVGHRPFDGHGRHIAGRRRGTVIGIPRTATAGTVTSPAIKTTGIEVGHIVKRIATIVTTTTITNGADIEHVRGGLAAAPLSPPSGKIARHPILWIARTAAE